jgi:hypothetical protein
MREGGDPYQFLSLLCRWRTMTGIWITMHSTVMPGFMPGIHVLKAV